MLRVELSSVLTKLGQKPLGPHRAIYSISTSIPSSEISLYLYLYITALRCLSRPSSYPSPRRTPSLLFCFRGISSKLFVKDFWNSIANPSANLSRSLAIVVQLWRMKFDFRVEDLKSHDIYTLLPAKDHQIGDKEFRSHNISIIRSTLLCGSVLCMKEGFILPNLKFLGLKLRWIEVDGFVAGISFRTTEESLSRAFSQFGKVLEARVIKNKVTNRNKGFAYVTFREENEAQNALEEMNGKVNLQSLLLCLVQQVFTLNNGDELWLLDGHVIYVDYEHGRCPMILRFAFEAPPLMRHVLIKQVPWRKKLTKMGRNKGQKQKGEKVANKFLSLEEDGDRTGNSTLVEYEEGVSRREGGLIFQKEGGRFKEQLIRNAESTRQGQTKKREVMGKGKNVTSEEALTKRNGPRRVGFNMQMDLDTRPPRTWTNAGNPLALGTEERDKPLLRSAHYEEPAGIQPMEIMYGMRESWALDLGEPRCIAVGEPHFTISRREMESERDGEALMVL
ncbi:RNA recognition motif domain [Dillenia turbinata]|uniref:RNA recognition motif domain n=1 Tax=Dillenia turbinata TaxID=194707 RepID=A0AAN8VUB3_9MAGN